MLTDSREGTISCDFSVLPITSQKGKKVNALKALGVAILVFLSAIFGFGLKAVTTPPQAAPIHAPDTNAVVLLKVKFSAYYKDANDPNAKWSNKPAAMESRCTGFIVGLDDNAAKIFTADHCVSLKEAAKELKQSLDPGSLFGMSDPDRIQLKSPDSDDPVSREVLVFRGDNVNGSRFPERGSEPQPDPSNAVKATVEDELPVDVQDEALLSVQSLPGPLSVLRLAYSQGNVGDQVAATGFPASLDDEGGTDPRLVTTFGHITSDPKVWTKDGANSITTDAQIWHGMSGGPLTNADGKVIGFNDKMSRDVAMETYPTNLADMKDFLGKHGIYPAQPHRIFGMLGVR